MATIEENLGRLLLTFSGVTALTGTGDAARIRPDRLHQDETIPAKKGAVIIEVDNEDPQNDLSGTGGLVYANVNLVCRAHEKAIARTLAEAIRTNDTDPGTGLAGYSGTPSGGSQIDAVLEDSQPTFTPREEGRDEGWYDVNCSYIVSHREVI